MPRRPPAKKPTRKAVAKKPAAKRYDPKPKLAKKAIRKASDYRSWYASMIARRDELDAKATELALKITMQERLISRLLTLLTEKPSEELRRAHAEILRLNMRLKTEDIP